MDPTDNKSPSILLQALLHQQWPSWLKHLFIARSQCINTLRMRQNGCHFADNVFKSIFLNENVWILIIIALKYVPEGPNNNIPALVQIMAWRRSGDKPLSEPMIVYWCIYASFGFNELMGECYGIGHLLWLSIPFHYLVSISLSDKTCNKDIEAKKKVCGWHFEDDIFRLIFLYENCILLTISLKLVRKGSIDKMPALVQIMAWHQIGDKPLSKPMITYFTNVYMHHLAVMS